MYIAAGRYNFTIDDRVFIEKKNIGGYVRYVGPTHFERVKFNYSQSNLFYKQLS